MRIKRNDLIQVFFTDYICLSGGLVHSVKCSIIGKVLSTDKKAIYVASWIAEEPNELDYMDSYTILKDSIEKVYKLKPLTPLIASKA
jgi:hypothetical protein